VRKPRSGPYIRSALRVCATKSHQNQEMHCSRKRSRSGSFPFIRKPLPASFEEPSISVTAGPSSQKIPYPRYSSAFEYSRCPNFRVCWVREFCSSLTGYFEYSRQQLDTQVTRVISQSLIAHLHGNCMTIVSRNCASLVIH
jgi:hypothetical protein